MKYDLIVDDIFIGEHPDYLSALKEAEQALEGGAITVLIESHRSGKKSNDTGN